MLFTDLQFSIVITFALFALFFVVGYFSEKRSGGFFMILAGFAFLGFDVLVSSILNVYVSSLLSLFGIFIIILGVRKAFYPMENERRRSEGL